MMRTANLLPWRQRQQRRCLRFWGGMFTGSLLVALMLCATSRVSDALVTRASALRHASDVALRQGLEQRQKQWTALQAKHQQQQRWMRDKARTEAWQPALIALSHLLPEQAWLAQLRFQQSTLSLTGYAATLPAWRRWIRRYARCLGLPPVRQGRCVRMPRAAGCSAGR